MMECGHLDEFGNPLRDRETISGVTGFDSGEKFENDNQVREYFDYSYIRESYSPDDCYAPTQATLDEWAGVVILNKWHMDTGDDHA